MGIKLSALKSKSRELEIVYQDEPLKIEYFTNVVTPMFQAELEQIKDVQASLVFQVKRVVKSWELFDDEDHPVPLEDEVLTQLPTEFLMKIVTEVIDDMKMEHDVKKG